MYQPAGEKAAWIAESDPIPKLRGAILAEGLADEAALADAETAARADVRAAAQVAAEQPAADPSTLEHHVYG